MVTEISILDTFSITEITTKTRLIYYFYSNVTIKKHVIVVSLPTMPNKQLIRGSNHRREISTMMVYNAWWSATKSVAETSVAITYWWYENIGNRGRKSGTGSYLRHYAVLTRCKVADCKICHVLINGQI